MGFYSVKIEQTNDQTDEIEIVSYKDDFSDYKIPGTIYLKSVGYNLKNIDIGEDIPAYTLYNKDFALHSIKGFVLFKRLFSF